MQVGSTLSNDEDRSELGHRTTQRPPLLSTPTAMPLMGNQNLDNVKRGGTNSQSITKDSGSRKRPILAIRTVSPFVQQANSNTSPTPAPKFYSNLRDKQLVPSTNGQRRKGKTKTDSLQYGTKETKRKRNEPVFSSKIKDILEWRTMKLGTDVHLERQDNGTHESAKKTEKAAGDMRDMWESQYIKPPKNKGPKAGQLYEIVNHHIIQDNIDKTVTISTWREQVDEGYGSDTDKMSIYYIGPDGYAPAGVYTAEVNTRFERRLLESAGVYAAEVNTKLERRLVESRHGSKEGNQGTPYRPVEAGNGPSSTSTKSRNSQHNNIGSTTTDPLQQKKTRLSASNKEKHTRSQAKTRNDPSPWDSLTRLKTQDGPFIQRQGHYQESTPIEKGLPPPPFHPTCSGSTISSVRSASTADFEKFLDGCKPSLVHVSNILESLGICKLEHLKAVAKLSPETRDREVKEDALRLGITVMEWAILVDNIIKI